MGVFAVLYMPSRIVGTGMLQSGTEGELAEQGSGTDALQRPLCSRFRARLTPGVRLHWISSAPLGP
jgi:hypothetical protein